MMNMSYCRFENTAKAMMECLNAIEDGDLYDFTPYELAGFKRVFAIAQQIVDNEEVLERMTEWYEEGEED